MENTEIISHVLTGLVLLVVGYVSHMLQGRPRLLWYAPGDSQFVVDGTDGDFRINTGSATVQNVGRKKAENVEIIFAFEPTKCQLQPSMNHETQVLKDGQFVIKLATLGPKELVTLQVLYGAVTPTLQQVRSDAGPAKQIPVWLARRYPPWFNTTAALLVLLGLGVVAYVVIKLGIAAWPILFGT